MRVLLFVLAALFCACRGEDVAGVVLERAAPKFVLQTTCGADADCSGRSCVTEEVAMGACVRGAGRRSSYRVTRCDPSGVEMEVFLTSRSCEGTPLGRSLPANQCYRAAGTPFGGAYAQTLCSM